jgi:parvulin-like peptidyl-prolyl isomerase
MKRILYVFGLVFTLSTTVGAQKGTSILATVGTKKITLDEFNKKYSEVLSQTLSGAPSKKVFLEDLIRYEMGLQEARKQGIEKDPQFQERVNQELYKSLLERELGKKVQESQVSEEEMKAWYKNNPQIRISSILIEVKPGATASQRAEARKRAEEILKEVRGSKRAFEELVRLYSDDTTTKALGGDIGWQSRITLNPTFYESALRLKLNQITTSLVETPFGFHILKLTGQRSFEEATQREIRMAVFDEKRKKHFDNYFNGIKKNYSVNVNDKLLQ